jgi:hypothetical protein
MRFSLMSWAAQTLGKTYANSQKTENWVLSTISCLLIDGNMTRVE